MIWHMLLSLGAIGLILACSIGLYYIMNIMVSGAYVGNWLMVIAGGILAYMFMGLLLCGIAFGIVILGIVVMDIT